MNTLESLLARALVVMNETRKKLNTASRVGSLLRDILLFLQNAVLGILLKGSLANAAAIQAVSAKSKGDTYRAIDTGHYWTYDGTAWNNIGVIIPTDVATQDDIARLEREIPIVNSIDSYPLTRESARKYPDVAKAVVDLKMITGMPTDQLYISFLRSNLIRVNIGDTIVSAANGLFYIKTIAGIDYYTLNQNANSGYSGYIGVDSNYMKPDGIGLTVGSDTLLHPAVFDVNYKNLRTLYDFKLSDVTRSQSDVDELTKLDLTFVSNNQGIGDNGEPTFVGTYKIVSYSGVMAGEVYRVKTLIGTYGTTEKKGYAFYRTKTVSASSYISGSQTVASADIYEDVTVPADAVMICLTVSMFNETYGLFKKEVSVLSKINTANTNIKTISDEINVIKKSSVIFNTPKFNLLGSQFIHPSLCYIDQSKTDLSAVSFAQADPYIYHNTQGIISDVNDQAGRTYNTPNTLTPSGGALLFTLISTKIRHYLVAVKYDEAMERFLYFTVVMTSGGSNAYAFSDGILSQGIGNKFARCELLSKESGIAVWRIETLEVDGAIDARCGIRIGNTGIATQVSIFNVIASNEKINLKNTYIELPHINNSYLLGKNVMIFGDSNMRTTIGQALICNLGCSIYQNGAGGRAMTYWKNSDTWDLAWLYHWERRKYLASFQDANIDLNAFIFLVSYNDSSGGGELSDTAIQAVLDNYPVIGDNDTTVLAKLSLFNNLSENDRKAIFGFKQTYAAYLQQIINRYPTSSIYLTTMLYSPSTDNSNPNIQRSKDKPTRDALNSDIRDIAGWFGIPVIDTNTCATYYYGNMVQQGTTNNIHFNYEIGHRIGYYVAKEVAQRTCNTLGTNYF